MGNTPAQRRRAAATWETEAGVVVATTDEGVRVALAAGGQCEAARAVSCLVAPEAGDRVLVACGGDEAYVLAVLDRGGDAPLRLETRADTELRVDGTLTLAARGIQAHAVEIAVATTALAISSAGALLDFARVRAVAGTVDAVVDRVLSRVKRAYRFVEEVDQLRAGRIDYEAESALALHAENAMVTADELVKVDAEQIQLG